MRGRVFSAYFESLARGDAEAIGITILIVAVAVCLIGAVWFVGWRAKNEDKRYKEELRKRRGY